jgi:hypothetical protein
MSSRRWTRRVGTIALVAVLGVAVAYGTGIAKVAFRLLRPYDLPAPARRPPFASLSVHQVQWKDCKAVEGILERGSFVCGVIDCGVFRGFLPGMSPEAAKARHGPAHGEWHDPHYDVRAYYYDVPFGRISLARAPDSGSGHWVTVGYPKRALCKDVVRDARVLAQLQEIKGSDSEIYLTLLPAGGDQGGISLHVTGTRCESLEFDGTEPGYDEAGGSAEGRLTRR